MASSWVEDDLAISTNNRRSSFSVSFEEMLTASPDVFNVTGRNSHEYDERELKLAAIDRLSTFDRTRKEVLDDGKVFHEQVEVTRLGFRDKKVLMESILKVVEEDNEKFLRRLRDRVDRVGIEVPKIEVRYENLSVEGDVYVGSRALPTLLNATLNIFENMLGLFHLAPSKKKEIQILRDVSGIVKPSR